MFARQLSLMQHVNDLEASANRTKVDHVPFAAQGAQLGAMGHGTRKVRLRGNGVLAGVLEKRDVPISLAFAPLFERVTGDRVEGVFRGLRVVDGQALRRGERMPCFLRRRPNTPGFARPLANA